ncbi:MAG: hypothetical protein ACR2PG_14810 [Hyphomicrobiaceae bacterium]
MRTISDYYASFALSVFLYFIGAWLYYRDSANGDLNIPDNVAEIIIWGIPVLIFFCGTTLLLLALFIFLFASLMHLTKHMTAEQPPGTTTNKARHKWSTDSIDA